MSSKEAQGVAMHPVDPTWLEAEVATLHSQLVFGFYEERVPSFHQGLRGSNELMQLVTAEEVTGYVANIEQLTATLKTAERALDRWKERCLEAEDSIRQSRVDTRVEVVLTLKRMAANHDDEGRFLQANALADAADNIERIYASLPSAPPAIPTTS